jgi:hypothetical protein
MDFNHQYYGGFVVDLFYDFNADDYLENINNNGFASFKATNYLSYGVIVILFIYSTTSAFQR